MIPKIITILLLITFSFASTLDASEKDAYRVFTREGDVTNYQELLTGALEANIILFGELHNNPVAHWLQYELSHDLLQHKETGLVLGAEMLESDNQLLINEYVDGHIQQRHFKAEAKLWDNYDTDYEPLVELARENGIPFVATNIPRRYAAVVHRGGFEALDKLDSQAKTYIAPLPVPYDPELPGYKAMLEMDGMPGHGNENFPKAQAIKDATMAHFILENHAENDTFLHFNGAYHSNNDEGIVWYLQEYSDNAPQVMTISTVEQADIDTLEAQHTGLADFIIVVPDTMTKTH